MLRRPDGSLRGSGGYTLVELVAVMTVFFSIVTALVALFTSGARTELDLNRRVEAQQNARIALDKLRRELHCADGITDVGGNPLPATPVAAIKVSLPSQCPTAQGVPTTVTYDMASAGEKRWKLRRTKGGTTVNIADYITSSAVFTYYPKSPASRARLHVVLPVNLYPNEGWKQWRLADDIVLRNTLRQ